MRRFVSGFLFACCAAFATGFISSGDAAAEPAGPVVVELFTSQGCSSCPPADAFLGELAKRDDVIALSLHVDYWDYLGWRDIFGSSAHTQRQRRYAAMLRERMIYTPQVVIHGREHVVGSRTEELSEAITRVGADAPAALVDVVQKDGALIVSIRPNTVGERLRGAVLMAWYTDSERVRIQRGENRGRDMVYHNVVKGWADMGVWSGGPVALTAAKPMEADGVAVLVQGVDGGPILGAARIALQ